ncbi:MULTISPECIES: zf-HC2 domain-containing protein [unclassified Streptomyces]|uniref:anti-sigma factor family protein n=1 Tax=unclassified Streptomyces TaxID=2593676 RepID=UPI0036E9B0F6
MSGSRPNPAEGRFAEQHLGDRLAALVDGELGHETRERVLAHLATCAKCKAEADAQRRLKNVFAEAAPPPPSESFLARLQGLPGGGDTDGGSPFGGGFRDGFSGRPGTSGVFGVKRPERFAFDYVPAAHTPALGSSSRDAFPLHDVGRHEADRSASRGMRFAFVVGGAVSLAAIALGGVTTGTPTDADARGPGGSNVTPARTQGGTGAATPDTQRRRALGPLFAQDQSRFDAPVASTEMSAPLVPGTRAHEAAVTTPVVAGAAAMSPLIRPLSATPPVTLTSLSTAPGLAPPGLLAAPVPLATSSPSGTTR